MAADHSTTSDELFALNGKSKAPRDRKEYQKARRNANREAHNAKRRAYYKSRPDLQERHRAENRAYREVNKARLSEYKKEYRRVNHEKLKDKVLRKRYGLTINEVAKLKKAQDFRCAICRVPFDLLSSKHCHVDHDHKKGNERDSIRGVLCNHCNSVLGHANDDPKILRQAIEYLKRYA